MTHWGRDPNIGMSYSFVKENATGEDYDVIAEDVEDRLYFCGEVNYRGLETIFTEVIMTKLSRGYDEIPKGKQ